MEFILAKFVDPSKVIVKPINSLNKVYSKHNRTVFLVREKSNDWASEKNSAEYCI